MDTPTGEHREEELRKGLLVFFLLLTVNSGLVMYISWGDLVSVASVGVTYVAVGLLLGRRFGCWEPTTDGGRRWLGSVICFLFLSLGVLQVSRLARTAASSTTSAPMLVAAAGATALGVAGCCSYLLHRRSWYVLDLRLILELKSWSHI
jgi:hypothetical protein